MIKFNVSIPPSINHCYFYKGGRRIKTTKAREFERETETIVRHLKVKKFEDDKKIICNLVFYFPDNRRRDTHNTLKLLFDSIERAGFYKDDRYVLPQVLDWTVDRENPRVELEFYLKKEKCENNKKISRNRKML